MSLQWILVLVAGVVAVLPLGVSRAWSSVRAETLRQPHDNAADSAPDLGPNVLIIDPGAADAQARIDAVFARQEHGQFNSNRFAILLKPGAHNLDIRVGFYTHVAGLGRSPADVSINGAVRVTAEWMKGNATCNFWRCAENFSLTPAAQANDARKPNVWAVSQGASLRRVHIKGDVNLSDGGWSSGGFIADSVIDGVVDSGSQQQWLSRNTSWGRWQGGNWNMVFVGTINPPAGLWPDKPYTVVEQTPVIREKPYLILDQGPSGAEQYALMVPALRLASQGTTWGNGPSAGAAIPLTEFFIARPETDTAASINAALAAGKHLFLTPGVYRLAESIRVTRPGTIIFGLGYPTLIAGNGRPAIELADVDNLTVSGVLLEAGATESPTLLQVGEPGSTASHAERPTLLADVFCRAGGAAAGSTTTMVTINSRNVLGDNLWLWRADHGAGHAWTASRNQHGIIVNGADATIYGLFVEHAQQYQTIWNAEGGRVYFYQSEMPYDPPSQEAWSHDGVRGYASYKVAGHVQTHEAFGLGVYCVFRAAPVIADAAIEAPITPGVKLHHMIAVRLDGLPGSGIAHVLNRQGDSVITTKTSRLE